MERALCESVANHGGRSVTPYQQYNGTYDKRFYKVRTLDGRNICEAWPNAGHFHVTCDCCGNGVVKRKEIESISPTQTKW